MKRLGRILIISGIILLFRPDVLAHENMYIYYEAIQQYWPAALIVIGFFFIERHNQRKSHRIRTK